MACGLSSLEFPRKADSVSNLEKLKNAWEGLAERDALSAILTDDSKVGGKWNIAEFMATGDAEIETVMNHLARIGHAPDSSGAALDFGCGVGRLTQALARRFASSVGVDISKHMIEQAQSLNQYPHCRYVASSAARLPFDGCKLLFHLQQHRPPACASPSREELPARIRKAARAGRSPCLRRAGLLRCPKSLLTYGPDSSRRASPVPDQSGAQTWAGRHADALLAGTHRSSRTRLRQGGGHSVHQYSGPGLQRQASLSRRAAGTRLHRQAILRDSAAIIHAAWGLKASAHFAAFTAR